MSELGPRAYLAVANWPKLPPALLHVYVLICVAHLSVASFSLSWDKCTLLELGIIEKKNDNKDVLFSKTHQTQQD